MNREHVNINADTQARVECNFMSDRAWISLSFGPLHFTPDITRETAAELRKLADQVDAVYKMFDRTAEAESPSGPFVFRHEPSGEIRDAS